MKIKKVNTNQISVSQDQILPLLAEINRIDGQYLGLTQPRMSKQEANKAIKKACLNFLGIKHTKGTKGDYEPK